MPAKLSAASPRPPAISTSNLLRDYRILVIDDNAINCEVIRDILSIEGFSVDICLDSQKAMATMKENPPNLIRVDLTMPSV